MDLHNYSVRLFCVPPMAISELTDLDYSFLSLTCKFLTRKATSLLALSPEESYNLFFFVKQDTS